MAGNESGLIKQESQDSSTEFQVEANAGSQLDQAAQDIHQTISQAVEGSQNQAIGQVYGGVVVYVSGGQAVINQPQSSEAQASGSEAAKAVGPNPYKGLLAFHEKDRALYFGRSREIETLWNQFRDLHEQANGIRLLPIYGPSGSGKSSLARAGLIPELGQRPLPGRDRARVAVMVPGTKPLQALAGILARIAKQDAMAVGKTREFAKELALANDDGEFDGLHRIASLLPEIQSFPLVVLIDQFEEVYSLGEDVEKRDALIANLLYAAKERSQYVSVILTMRNDFVGETHRHPELGRLFSTQGFLVPPMDEEALREVIALPAEQAGHPLDDATIQLLIEQTEGREGALPLLQFALTRIWEGLAEGNMPAKTLESIGGVGGALAGEAQRVYDGLSEAEQEIARRLFLGLVHLGEGTRDTRRRASVSSLMARSDESKQFRQVMERFTAPGVRLVTVSAEGGEENAEVTHEALFEHWRALNAWLDDSRDDLRFQRRLDEAALYWDQQKRPAGLLWRNPDLGLLRDYNVRLGRQMTALQLVFFEVSVGQETQLRRREARQKQVLGLGVSLLAVLAVGTTWLALQFRQAERRAQARELATQSEQLANHPSVETQEVGAWLALKSLEISQPLKEESDETNSALRQIWRKLPLVTLNHGVAVTAVAFSPQGFSIATASDDGTARVWDAETGQHLATLDHEDEVVAVSFSPDGKYIATASLDDTARLWDMKTGQKLATLNHSDDVSSVEFSPDGKQLATASLDNTVQLWNVDTREKLATLNHDGGVTDVAFSSNGKRIATASLNGTAWLWDGETWESLETLNHDGEILDLAFSPDGRRIATANLESSTRCTTRLWDVGTGQVVVLNHQENVYTLEFSPDGKHIVTGSRDGTARAWNVETGQPLASFKHDALIASVAFSRHGRRFATASLDATARLWDFETGELLATLNHNGSVPAIAFSFDEKRIATASSDGTARLWNLETMQHLATLEHKGKVSKVAFRWDGESVATASADGTAVVWDEDTGRRLATLNHDEPVSGVAFSPNGRRVATASLDSTARLWDGQTWRKLASLQHDGPVSAVVFSPDGNYVATASFDNTARLWNVETGQSLKTLEHNGKVSSVIFSPDGKHVATASLDGTAQLWVVETGQSLKTFEHDGEVMAVTFSPDGKHVATASFDQTVQLWNAETGQHLKTLNHEGPVYAVAFSPDGKRIATSSANGTAQLWGVQTGKHLATLNHDKVVKSVVFSPDGKQLATASWDGTAGVWEVETGKRLATLNHDDSVLAVTFSPDGRRVATASQDSTARVHWLSSEDLTEQVCQRLGRNLTASEWRSYMQTDFTKYTLACGLPVHPTLLTEAQKLAETGNLRKAAGLYSHLLKVSRNSDLQLDLDPLTKDTVEQDPRTLAKDFAVGVGAVRQAETLALEGKVNEAIARYQKALKLNPDIDLNPATEEDEQDPEALANAISEASVNQ